ncbi:MAG: hypothetical protein KR126chlam6_01280, partial [Candidatus Anoxychlamydiales bacterium]|nr:hypothetical protein [Candidatus Anoxychlamydiales bacterium]
MEKRCFKCNYEISNKESWYGLHPECFKQWFKVSSLDKFQNIISRKQSDEPLFNKAMNSSFFHGKFR